MPKKVVITIEDEDYKKIEELFKDKSFAPANLSFDEYIQWFMTSSLRGHIQMANMNKSFSEMLKNNPFGNMDMSNMGNNPLDGLEDLISNIFNKNSENQKPADKQPKKDKDFKKKN